MQADFSCDLRYHGSGFSTEEMLEQLGGSYERDEADTRQRMWDLTGRTLMFELTVFLRKRSCPAATKLIAAQSR